MRRGGSAWPTTKTAQAIAPKRRTDVKLTSTQGRRKIDEIIGFPSASHEPEGLVNRLFLFQPGEQDRRVLPPPVRSRNRHALPRLVECAHVGRIEEGGVGSVEGRRDEGQVVLDVVPLGERVEREQVSHSL